MKLLLALAVIPTLAFGQGYPVTLPACNGTQQVTCSGIQPPLGPVCAITMPVTIPSGQNTILTLTCTVANGAPITYKWQILNGQTVGTAASFYNTGPLTQTTSYVATATANGIDASYGTTVMVSQPANSCAGLHTVDLGTLPFTGADVISQGMSGDAVGVGKIVIPNPFPAGWQGKTTQVSVFPYTDGQQWRFVYLGHHPCDFVNYSEAGQGISVSLYMSFGVDTENTVRVNPGDTFYLTVQDKNRNGTPSCSSGQSCNFAMRLYPPN